MTILTRKFKIVDKLVSENEVEIASTARELTQDTSASTLQVPAWSTLCGGGFNAFGMTWKRRLVADFVCGATALLR
jgi:hypothetical protein